MQKTYMQRCLELAKNGIGNVSPNPMVGCVIVYNNRIIGEGWHKKYGEAHAEVNAINNVKNKKLLKYSTLFVNLEPCSHYGKTPPCANLIIKHKIPKVVIGNIDPFNKVSGKGIEKLRNSGCEVVVGILNEECWNFNRFFFTSNIKKRPYIILKWAETKDGFIDNNKDFNIKGAKISNELSSKFSHKLRAENDAIMVGTNTTLIDNPKLDVRKWKGENPIRIVIDKNLRLHKNLELFSNNVKTIVFNNKISEIENKIHFVKISFKNPISEILIYLNEQNIQSLIIEGGAKLLQSFIDAKFWDEALVFVANKKFKNGVKAPKINQNYILEENISFDKLLKFIR